MRFHWKSFVLGFVTMAILVIAGSGIWLYGHYQKAKPLFWVQPIGAAPLSAQEIAQSFKSMEFLRSLALQMNLPTYAAFAESSLGSAYGAKGAQLAPGLEQSTALAASRHYFDSALRRSLDLADAGNPLPLFYTAQAYAMHLYSTGEILRAAEVSMKALSYRDQLQDKDSSLIQTLLQLTEKMKK